MTHSYVTWLICIPDKSGSFILLWHMNDSYVKCLIPIGHDSFMYYTTHFHPRHMKQGCLIYIVMTHSLVYVHLTRHNHRNNGNLWMSHVPRGWVMSHMNESCHIWMSHVTKVRGITIEMMLISCSFIQHHLCCYDPLNTHHWNWYGVATITRLLMIIRLLCRI